MQTFPDLLIRIEQSLSSKSKVITLSDYFKSCSTSEASWAVFFLLANRLPKTISNKELLTLAQQVSGLEDWLLQESCQHVGNIAEAVTLIIKSKLQEQTCGFQLSNFIEQEFIDLRAMNQDEKYSKIVELWKVLDFKSCLLFNKLLLSNLRIPITAQQLTLSLAEISSLPQSTIAARLTGKWIPSAQTFTNLISEHSEIEKNSIRPQAFNPIHPIDLTLSDLGNSNQYHCYEKWDGIRVQLVNVAQACLIWTEGQEDLSKSLPELAEKAAEFLPLNTILEGDIVAWKDSHCLSYLSLQRRLSRRQASKKLQEEIPVKFIASDILFFEGRDLREEPFAKRREILEQLFADEALNELGISSSLEFANWNILTELRSHNKHLDIVLKAKASCYQKNEKEKNCWLWEKDPSSILAVLVCVNSGQGYSANSPNDYTFAVWKNETFVPIGKANENISEELNTELIQFISENTLERFGPVSTLRPELVFEISYDSVSESSRHKSGVTLRNPKIKSLCKDKSLKDVAKLETLKQQLLRT